MITLTEKQAFRAMVLFLQNFYNRTQSDDVGSLLGELMFFEDGTTADPAAWQDWVESVEEILNRGENMEQGEMFKLIKNDEAVSD
jgi:hypothetical protein